MAQQLHLYPLRTEPVYRHYIWGGTRLKPLLGKPLGPEGTLAESWEVADEARVASGRFQGQTLRELDETTGGALSGEAPHYANAQLPLLIKLSDAARDLSIQIHPTDEQALRDEPGRGYPGKAEMYVILEAEPGAGVYWNLRPGVTAEHFARACGTGAGVPELLNFIPVKAGDVLYLPAGVLHALGKGIVYCEIQENSDITYRLYDWGRLDADGKPRPLHIERGLAVLRLDPRPSPVIEPLPAPATNAAPEIRLMQTADGVDAYPVAAGGGTRTILCACPHFAVELLELNGTASLTRARPAMRAIVVLEGEVTLSGDDAESSTCARGQSAVLPAALANQQVSSPAPARILLAYLPDLSADIIDPLRAAGHSDAAIAQLGDVAGL